ncbi:MAG: tRNA (adenosine(37)-N6)-dimethylallyltransferase MiaA [Candidatus Abyssubacteria bacterium]
MPELLVVCGPTAVGKSMVGILLAEWLDGEIISADSMQVYRGLDIGTDKVPPELRARVPHHMIDIAEPSEGFSAARYEREARQVIDRLVAEGKLPIVVGGSGLYIRALIQGIFPAPPASADIRNRLKREAAEHGVRMLHERLAAVDPAYARVASPTDLRRIVRALEVFELTGTPFSAWHERHQAERTPRKAFLVGLTRGRDDLYRRIDSRVDQMFAQGLVRETQSLCQKSHLRALKNLKALGYTEVLSYLEGRLSLEDAIHLTKRNSRRYAKRQMTWFRKETVRWVELQPDDDAERSARKVLHLLPENLKRRLRAGDPGQTDRQRYNIELT